MQVKHQQFIAARWLQQAVTWVKEGSPDYIPGASHTWNGERRKRTRAKMSFEADLSVNGQTYAVQGIDLHEFGAQVRCQTSITPGTEVFFNLVTRRLVGFATVRHCTRRGNGSYGIGLEFPTELMPKEPGDWHFSRVSKS